MASGEVERTNLLRRIFNVFLLYLPICFTVCLKTHYTNMNSQLTFWGLDGGPEFLGQILKHGHVAGQCRYFLHMSRVEFKKRPCRKSV